MSYTLLYEKPKDVIHASIQRFQWMYSMCMSKEFPGAYPKARWKINDYLKKKPKQVRGLKGQRKLLIARVSKLHEVVARRRRIEEKTSRVQGVTSNYSDIHRTRRINNKLLTFTHEEVRRRKLTAEMIFKLHNIQ